MLTAFLSQTGISRAVRGGDVAALISSPYFAYSLLNFGSADPDAAERSAMQESVAAAVELIVAMRPENKEAAAQYLVNAMAGLDAVVSMIFAGDRAAYVAAIVDRLGQIADPNLKQIATAIVNGDAAIGTNASDGLVASAGNNLFVGGKGDDVFISGEGADLFVYTKGDGSDFIRDSATSKTENDRLLLTNLSASDIAFERIGDTLIIRVKSTNEKIASENFFRNWGQENAGIDSIILQDGSVLNRENIRALTTTVGDGRGNYIEDTTRDDVIRGGAGDDKILIREGNDTVIYAPGDGNDLITSWYKGANEVDVLVLSGLNPSDVELSRNDNTLFIKVLSTGEYIINEYFFATSAADDSSGGWGIDRIRFENGVTWGRKTIEQNAWWRGSDKDDSISGSSGNDNFVGGKGSDVLSGGAGADTYHWRKGDGSDTISETDNSFTNADRLVLSDVSMGDVQFIRSGEDLLIEILSTGEVIKVQSQFVGMHNIVKDKDLYRLGLESIEFKNGQVLGRDDFMRRISNLGLDLDIQVIRNVLGTDGKPTTEKETISYHQYTPSSSGGSSVALPVGIFFVDELGNKGNYFDPKNIPNTYAVVDNGNDILIGMDDSESIGNGYSILASDPTSNENISFHGTSGGSGGGSSSGPGPGIVSLPVKNSGDNYFDGGKGNDNIVGGQGDDVLIGGDGNDVLYGDGAYASENSFSGYDMLDGGAGNDILRGGGKSDILIGGDGADRLYGGDGDDTLTDQSSEDDYFEGGKGNDVITALGNIWYFNEGANGNDTYAYQLGDGNDYIFDGSHNLTEIDKLILSGINSNDVEYTKNGYDLIIRILSTGEQITNAGVFWNLTTLGQGIDQIHFADGVVRTRASFGKDLVFRGSDANETLLNDDDFDSLFIAGKGDDIIMSAPVRGNANGGGGNGNDTFLYSRGDGNDLFFDGSHSTTEVDKLILTDIKSTDVLLSWVGIDLLIKDVQTGSLITNEGFFWAWGWVGQGIDIVQFSDGVSWDRTQLMQRAWVRGTETNDTLEKPDAVANTFWGGLGDDTIKSGNGDDTYIYALGDGNDVINDTSIWSSGFDTLKLSGINPEDVRLSVDGYNLVISIVTSGQRIIDTDTFYGRSFFGFGIDRIDFGNGATWSSDDIRYWAQEGSLYYEGTSGNETLIGSYLDQNLSGGGGDDIVDGGLGDDLVYGGAGDDVLKISVAGAGDIDQLDGQAGTDTASFSSYNGSILADLVLNGGEIRTSDGTVRAGESDRLIGKMISIENITGSAFNDRLAGDDSSNVISGLSGDDELTGRSGNDVYVYRLGDGNDTIVETDSGGTADQIKLEGLLPSQMSFARSGWDLFAQYKECGRY